MKKVLEVVVLVDVEVDDERDLKRAIADLKADPPWCAWAASYGIVRSQPKRAKSVRVVERKKRGGK